MLLPTLSVFANTDSKISVVMEYIVISPSEDGSTQITTRVSYKNLTDQEYKGDGQSEGVISVLLPEGATGLSMLDEPIPYKETETGFITTESIPASGTSDFSYTYQLKQGQEIALKFNLPIDSYQVLVPEGSGSVDIKDAEFTSMGLLEIGEKQNFWGYALSNIKKDQTVTIAYDKDKQPSSEETKASDSTSTSTSTDNENLGNVTKSAPDFHNPGHLRIWSQSSLNKFNPHILMIVLGIILIAGIGYYSYFRWKNRAKNMTIGSDSEEKAFKQLMSKQKAILDKIIELEENLGNGQMTEDEYKTKLEAYKQHLIQVKLSLRHFVE